MNAASYGWLAIGLNIYLFAVFVISASADFLRWRRELQQKIKEHVDLNRAREFTVDSAVEAAIDELQGQQLRLEAPNARMNHEFIKYSDQKRSFYRMFFINSPVALIHHALLLYFPVLLFLAAVLGLVLWTLPQRASIQVTSTRPVQNGLLLARPNRPCG